MVLGDVDDDAVRELVPIGVAVRNREVELAEDEPLGPVGNRVGLRDSERLGGERARGQQRREGAFRGGSRRHPRTGSALRS